VEPAISNLSSVLLRETLISCDRVTYYDEGTVDETAQQYRDSLANLPKLEFVWDVSSGDESRCSSMYLLDRDD
jgi:hypothetical protein